jgi:sulfur carrier protein
MAGGAVVVCLFKLNPRKYRLFLSFICSSVAKLIVLTINGKAREFAFAEMHVAALVEHLGLTGKRLAIELNGEIVPRSQFAQVSLQSGDKLEIVGAVGGG